MKKIIAITLAALICAFTLCACSRTVDPKEEKLKPTNPIAPEAILPETDFVGTYSNNDYTVTVIQGDDELFYFTVRSVIKDGKSSEWKMTGYFSGETYRVNYTDAVKINTYYYSNGSEKSSETEYEDGAGRMQFSADGTLVWNNSSEKLTGSDKFKKIK